MVLRGYFLFHFLFGKNEVIQEKSIGRLNLEESNFSQK